MKVKEQGQLFEIQEHIHKMSDFSCLSTGKLSKTYTNASIQQPFKIKTVAFSQFIVFSNQKIKILFSGLTNIH